MDKKRDFQETRNGVYLNDEKIGDVLFIDRMIFEEEEQEYKVLFHFIDQVRKEPVEFTEFVSRINAAWLHKIMVGNGASNIYAKKLYEYFLIKVDAKINRRGLPFHPNFGEVAYGKSHHLHTVPCPPIEVLRQYNSLGWKNRKEGLVFQGGSKLIAGGEQDTNAEYGGEYQVISVGKFDTYKDMLKQEVLGNIPLESILAIGASATVLEFANQKWDANLLNPLLHIYNDTTCGKTTAGCLMVSMGSLPDKKRNKNTLFLDFNVTNNALMQLIGSNTGFPLVIDEFSLKKEKNITENIYALADGKEKGRYKRGMRSTDDSMFSTAILLTGEESVLQYCDAKGGLRTRLFEICGVSWTSSAKSADYITEVCRNNYGFVTPLIAQILLREKDYYWKSRMDRWKNLIIKKAYREKVFVEVTERISKTVALFMVATELLCKVLDMPLSVKEVFEFFYIYIIKKAADDANIGNRAYRYLKTYFAQNKPAFTVDAWNLNFGAVSSPNADGVVYSIKSPRIIDGVVYDRVVCLTPNKAKEIFAKGGFGSIKVCMASIKARGLLMTKDKERLMGSFRINNEECTGYKILIPEESYYEMEE